MARKIVSASGKGGAAGKSYFGCPRARRERFRRHGQTHPPNRLRYRPAQLGFDPRMRGKPRLRLGGILRAVARLKKRPYRWAAFIFSPRLCATLPAFTPGAMHSLTAQYDAFFDDILIDAPAGIERGFALRLPVRRRKRWSFPRRMRSAFVAPPRL